MLKKERDNMIKFLNNLEPKEETKLDNSGFESNNSFDYFESVESPIESSEESVQTDSGLSEEIFETVSSEEELFGVKND